MKALENYTMEELGKLIEHAFPDKGEEYFVNETDSSLVTALYIDMYGEVTADGDYCKGDNVVGHYRGTREIGLNLLLCRGIYADEKGRICDDCTYRLYDGCYEVARFSCYDSAFDLLKKLDELFDKEVEDAIDDIAENGE